MFILSFGINLPAFYHECHSLNDYRTHSIFYWVPEKFKRLGVNNEFQRVNFHYFHQITINFLSVCRVMSFMSNTLKVSRVVPKYRHVVVGKSHVVKFMK